jgi:hypothetical protein
MSVVTRLGPRDFRKQPWKNAGGTTTELAVHPATGRPLWRLSIADVSTSGPFSDYSGYERTIMLLEGDGMRLVLDEASEALVDRPYIPFVFDGAAKCHCTLLGGAVRDMNLMVDRTTARGALEVVTGKEVRTRTLTAAWTLLHALAGRAQASFEGADYVLEAGELLRIDGMPTTPLSLSCDGSAGALAVITVEMQR